VLKLRIVIIIIMKESWFWPCVVFKMLVAVGITLRTEFVPDEHWQSTEAAYALHFGKGHLTWEWYANIRSYVPPRARP